MTYMKTAIAGAAYPGLLGSYLLAKYGQAASANSIGSEHLADKGRKAASNPRRLLGKY